MRQSIEEKSYIKKLLILEKAKTLFWYQGYQSTSIKDIACDCDCRPANIYNYFSSKEEILYEVIYQITNQLVSLVKPLGEDNITSPVELMQSLVSVHFGFLVNMKQSTVLITDTGLKDLSAQHRQSIIELRKVYENSVLHIIRRGRESGDFANLDERIICYLITSVIVRSSVWFSPENRLNTDEVAKIIFDFVFRGIKIQCC
jgi:TetR/AcrR family transcriptional regulator, cholesterol catabolism regulator